MPENPEIVKLREENELLRNLGTRTGFFQTYFKWIPKYPTRVECFNAVNDKHLDLFGEYRYLDYNSFRHQYSKFMNNK